MGRYKPADECESDNFFLTIGDFSELILKEIEVRLEAISLPHYHKEEMVIVPLSLLARDLFCEECFSYLCKVVE